MTTSRLEDEWAIRRLLETYMRRNDDADLEGMLALFVEDAVYRVSGTEFVGHRAIRAFLVRIGFTADPVRWTDDGNLMTGPRGIHLLSSPLVELDGDEALVESDCVTVHRDSEGDPQLGILCRYRDRVRRCPDGEWRFAERTGVSLRRRTALDEQQMTTKG
jgi:hypothetical protein